MDTLIQIIKTEWTKKSRGNPGATLRNSVPNFYPINVLSVNGVTLQQVEYFESNDFEKPYMKEPKSININQLREIRLELHEVPRALKIIFWGTPIRQFYGKGKIIGSLHENSWLQIISNARIPYEDTTGYNKFVYNIFYGQKEKTNEILSNSKPVNIYNEEVNLY